jgi:hypothetical protein
LLAEAEGLLELLVEAEFECGGDVGLGDLGVNVAEDVVPVVAQPEGSAPVLDAVVGAPLLF